MKPFLTKLFRHIAQCALLFALVTVEVSGRAASLTDFGYQAKSVNGELSLGHRALVVIAVQFEDLAPLAHSVSYYDDYFFRIFRSPVSVNDAFREMSNNRFFWTRGGVVGPLVLPASQRYGNFANETLYVSNMVWQALSSGLFNLASYDNDGNGQVSQNELQIAIIKNEGLDNGAHRGASTIRDPHSTYAWSGGVALFEHQTDFATVVHEVSHRIDSRLNVTGGGGPSGLR